MTKRTTNTKDASAAADVLAAALAQTSLCAQLPPLVAVGRAWCFDHAVTLKASHNMWLRELKVKNAATGETLLRVKHTESVFVEVNTQMQLSAIFDVRDKRRNQVLTVEREGKSRRYDVHEGVYRFDPQGQPCRFQVDVTQEEGAVAFKDLATGEACRGVVEGSFRDRVAVLSVLREASGSLEAVARMSRPKVNIIQPEYFTVEVAAGVDVLLAAMVFVARWAEFERARPAMKSYSFAPTWSSN